MKASYLAATILAFVLIAAGIILIEEKAVENREQARLKDERMTRENTSGFPALESQIVFGRFYLCHASIWQANRVGTNYFAVLMEVAPGSNNVWQIAGTNRFFELPLMLTRGVTYLAGRGRSNTVYQPIEGKVEN